MVDGSSNKFPTDFMRIVTAATIIGILILTLIIKAGINMYRNKNGWGWFIPPFLITIFPTGFLLFLILGWLGWFTF